MADRLTPAVVRRRRTGAAATDGPRDHAASTPNLSQLKQGRALLDANDLDRARAVSSKRRWRAIPPPPKRTSCWASSPSARRISPPPPLRIPRRLRPRRAWPKPTTASASCWGSRAGRAEALRQFEEAVQLDPALFDAQYHLGATRWWTQGFRRRASRAAGRRQAAARSRRSPLLSRPDAATATDGWSPRSTSCATRSG